MSALGSDGSSMRETRKSKENGGKKVEKEKKKQLKRDGMNIYQDTCPDETEKRIN